MNNKPEILAIRAANQYRRRDIIGYLGLRYYLCSRCSIRDRWAYEVSTLLARFNENPSYHVAYNFKDKDKGDDNFNYRKLYIPTPNEIMAETALIDACGKSGGSFDNHSTVYSYRISKNNNSEGVFENYFLGFQERHQKIACAVKSHPNGIVIYTDIKNFYPSIKKSQVFDVWKKINVSSGLSSDFIDLGYKLLSGYASNCGNSDGGILTGPMFSHLIANLLLKDVDQKISEIMPGGYFRYVDDITLVGTPDEVYSAEKTLTELLLQLDLELNLNKRIEITTVKWLEGENDFSPDTDAISWKTVVGKTKQILLAKPEVANTIEKKFKENGFRIKTINYGNALNSQGYLLRVRNLLFRPWFRRLLQLTTPDDLIRNAQILRVNYTNEFWRWINQESGIDRYDDKRRIHALRKYASRLVFLANPADLPEMAESLYNVPELALFAVIFDSITKGDVSNLVKYGASAAYSAALPLLACYNSVQCDADLSSEPVRQSISILQAYGLDIKFTNVPFTDSMSLFCRWDSEPTLKSDEINSYFKELLSLHGVNEVSSRHSSILFTAFDIDEDLLIEVSDLMNYTSGF